MININEPQTLVWVDDNNVDYISKGKTKGNSCSAHTLGKIYWYIWPVA